MTLGYDTKTKLAFDSTMTLKQVPCNGAKKFLCEQKGINLDIDGEFIYSLIIDFTQEKFTLSHVQKVLL